VDTQLTGKFEQGLSPQQFIDTMTKNEEQFQSWHGLFVWPDEASKLFFEAFSREDLRCIILAADWCGDVIRNVPVVFQLTATANIPTKVLIMEQHLEVMDQFLTMGGRSIPVVLFINQKDEVVGRWGPRPTYIQEPMVAFKATNTDKDAPDYQANLTAARQELMRRYGDDTAYQTRIVGEIQTILANV